MSSTRFLPFVPRSRVRQAARQHLMTPAWYAPLRTGDIFPWTGEPGSTDPFYERIFDWALNDMTNQLFHRLLGTMAWNQVRDAYECGLERLRYARRPPSEHEADPVRRQNTNYPYLCPGLAFQQPEIDAVRPPSDFTVPGMQLDCFVIAFERFLTLNSDVAPVWMPPASRAANFGNPLEDMLVFETLAVFVNTQIRQVLESGIEANRVDMLDIGGGTRFVQFCGLRIRLHMLPLGVEGEFAGSIVLVGVADDLGV